MDKMKRIFSFVLVFAMLVGSFSSFSTIAFAEEVKEEVKVEEVKDTEVLSKVPSDVKGTEYEKAVTRLVAFGVIGGYPDGSYKPEEVINRAQFAKIVVVALGLNDAVPAAAHKATGFSDVQPGYWAAGYINVASGQGLLKGYPDGTFKPANQVSYAEALTILVRALGYQDEFLQGRWPGNYVSKAAEVGITKGVKLPTDAANGAKRGPVALLVNNAFDAKVVKVDTYKPNTGEVEYYETDIPLLKEKLEISKYEDTRIIADKIVDDGLEKDELRVRFLKDIEKEDKRAKYTRGEIVKRSYNAGDEDKYRFDSEFGQPRPVIGEEVTTYISDNDKVIFIEREDDDKAYFDFVEENDKDKLSLVAFDKSYDFNYGGKDDKDAAVVYVYNDKEDEFTLNDTKSELEDIKKDDLVGRMGKVVVKNNKIVYAEFQQASEVSSEFMLVRENNDGNLMGVTRTTADQKVDLRDDKDYDGALVFNTKGEKLSLKDIKKGNIVYIDQISYDGDDMALVTVVQDNKIEGEVGRVKNDRIEVAGKEIKVTKTSEAKFATYTNDGYDEIRAWDEEEAWEDDMEDAYKQDAVAYKDAVGRIAFLEIGGGNSGYKFGIVTRTYADGDRIRIYTTIDGKEGKDQIFKADKERDITSPRVLSSEGKETEDKLTGQTLLGSAVKFRLNADGEISDGKFFVMPIDNIYGMTDDFGKDVIKADKVKWNEDSEEKSGTSFVVPTDSVSVISAEGFTNDVKVKLEEYKDDKAGKAGNLDGLEGLDIDDFNVTTWKDIKEDKFDKAIKFYIFPKNSNTREVDGLVFVGKDGANTGSDEIAVYVLDRYRSGSDIKVEYVSYENNTKQTRILSNDDKLAIGGTEVKKEMAYAGKEKSNGKIELFGELTEKANEKVYDSKDYKVYRNVTVDSVDGNYIKTSISGNKDLYVSGALIYEEDKTKSISYLKDKKVDVVTDGIRTRVVSVVGDAKGTDKPGTGGSTDSGKILGTVDKEDKTFEAGSKIYTVGKEAQLFNGDNNNELMATGANAVLSKLETLSNEKDVKYELKVELNKDNEATKITYNKTKATIEAELEAAKKAKKAEIDKVVLTDDDKAEKTAESIDAAEDKLTELKEAAKKAVEDAKTVEDVNKVKVAKEEATKLLVAKKYNVIVEGDKKDDVTVSPKEGPKGTKVTVTVNDGETVKVTSGKITKTLDSTTKSLELTIESDNLTITVGKAE